MSLKIGFDYIPEKLLFPAVKNTKGFATLGISEKQSQHDNQMNEFYRITSTNALSNWIFQSILHELEAFDNQFLEE